MLFPILARQSSRAFIIDSEGRRQMGKKFYTWLWEFSVISCLKNSDQN
ncbi:hypothetical protein [Fischerella thermalis]|nr:hypothetical protein [Fischerella thermalis]